MGVMMNKYLVFFGFACMSGFFLMFAFMFVASAFNRFAMCFWANRYGEYWFELFLLLVALVYWFFLARCYFD